MFIQRLIITVDGVDIRNVEFKKGLNLIVDETPEQSTESGNDVGKTTFLRVIDFCLGKDARELMVDPDDTAKTNNLLVEFFDKHMVEVSLYLVDNLDLPKQTILVHREVSKSRKPLREINGRQLGKEEFKDELQRLLFPDVKTGKPTLKQLVAHNFRYKDTHLNSPLRMMDTYTTLEEYETLHLYLFGCPIDDGADRSALKRQYDSEHTFLNNLQRERTRGDFKSELDLVNERIERLETERAGLNINPELAEDIEELNGIREDLNRVAEKIGVLNIKRKVIHDSIREFEQQSVGDDVASLEEIYRQAKTLQPEIQRTFDEMVTYHNTMLANKTRFIREELPALNEQINTAQAQLDYLRDKERKQSARVTTSATFDQLESLISQLTELYQKRGECKNRMDQIDNVQGNVGQLHDKLVLITEGLHTAAYREIVDKHVAEFNVIFADMIDKFYDDDSSVYVDTTEKAGVKCYRFQMRNPQYSTGRKHGEISCFEIAYVRFADEHKIPCLHFLLHDKNELVHSNQLSIINNEMKSANMQYIMTALKSKLPEDMKDDSNIILTLSQNDKLFQIERFM